MEFFLCQLIFCLIANEQKLAKAKHLYAQTPDFSPVRLFQRIDRAAKGYLTREDIKSFMRENGLFEVGQLSLVVQKKKLTFQKFLKLILDREHLALYFQHRLDSADTVVRKIDRLSVDLEQGLCELLFLQISLKRDAEFFRSQLKSLPEYNIVDLFKTVAFSDQRDAVTVKSIPPYDLARLFTLENLLLTPE